MTEVEHGRDRDPTHEDGSPLEDDELVRAGLAEGRPGPGSRAAPPSTAHAEADDARRDADDRR